MKSFFEFIVVLANLQMVAKGFDGRHMMRSQSLTAKSVKIFKALSILIAN